MDARLFRRGCRTDNKRMIEAFAESGLTVDEVRWFTQKNAFHCRNSLNMTIIRCRFFNVKVVKWKNRVFLIKEEL